MAAILHRPQCAIPPRYKYLWTNVLDKRHISLGQLAARMMGFKLCNAPLARGHSHYRPHSIRVPSSRGESVDANIAKSGLLIESFYMRDVRPSHLAQMRITEITEVAKSHAPAETSPRRCPQWMAAPVTVISLLVCLMSNVMGCFCPRVLTDVYHYDLPLPSMHIHNRMVANILHSVQI